MPLPDSPRKRFQQSHPLKAAHSNLVDSQELSVSLDYALLQLQEIYSMDNSPTSAMNWYRLQGARRLIEVWYTLGDAPSQRKFERTDELYDPDQPKTK